MTTRISLVSGVDFVRVPTSDVAARWTSTFEDPDGNALALHHRYASRRGEGSA